MKIGLVLCGGGIRGISHLGILKAFDEFHIPVHHISGTSSGAIVGVLYASGLKPDEILGIVLNIRIMPFIRPSLGRFGFIKMEKLRPLFEKNLPVLNFEDLRIPVTVSATSVKDASTRYFSSGPIIEPLMASSAVPILFKPVEVDGQLYFDGGIVNNLPVEPLADCDKIIGSLSNPINENFQPSGMRNMIERTLLISVNTNTYSRREKCDIILEPEGLKPMRVLSFSKTKEIFRIGYEHAISRIDEIKEILGL